MDKGLIGLGLPGGEAAELGEQTGSDANGDELFGVAGLWPTGRAADTGGTAEFFIGGLRDIREIDESIRHTLCALCGWRGAR